MAAEDDDDDDDGAIEAGTAAAAVTKTGAGVGAGDGGADGPVTEADELGCAPNSAAKRDAINLSHSNKSHGTKQ